MTHPPETVRPGAPQHFAPYEVPQADALLTTPAPTYAAPYDQSYGAPSEPTYAAPYEATYAGAPAVTQAWSSSDVPQDPRVAAFGTGPVQEDPPLLSVALRWIVPVGAGVFGLLVGLVLAGSGDRPTAPVSISGPAPTVTATQQATVTETADAVAPSTVTRRVTTTVVKATAAAPSAAPTVTATVTATVRETVTVPARQPVQRPNAPGNRRAPTLLP